MVANQPGGNRELIVPKALDYSAKFFVDWPVQIIGIVPGMFVSPLLGGVEGAARDDISFFDGLKEGITALGKADVRRAYGLLTIGFFIVNEKFAIIPTIAKGIGGAFLALAGTSAPSK